MPAGVRGMAGVDHSGWPLVMLAVVGIAWLAACSPAGERAASSSAAQSAAAQPSREQILAAARELIAGVRYATLSTLNEAGAPESRLMEPFAPEQNFDIWMGTNAASSKVVEIDRRPDATLLYADTTREGYVSVSGRAVIVRDPAEKAKRWNPSWAVFYRDQNLGEDYVLIRLTPSRLEISSPKQGMNNAPDTWKPVKVDFGR